MEPSQQKVVDSLNATLRSLQEARDSISTNVVGYNRIIAQHDNLKQQIEELRDSYAKPRNDYVMTPDEIMLHNFQMAQKMVDGGMSPEAVSEAFKRDGIEMPAELIREITKPGALDGLSGNKKE